MSRSEQTERDELIARFGAFQHDTENRQLNKSLSTLLDLPLTVKQLKVLGIIIIREGKATAQQLGDTLGITLATVSGIVDRLVEQGMVRRTADATDRRVRHLVPTESGQAVVRQLIVTEPELRRTVFHLMSMEDLRALVQGVEALGRAMFLADEDDAEPAAPAGAPTPA
ncbi:MarR family winged helix-turn-helix transcriptional regulator [Mycetocola spongiae]|uniref:MarR family winged helix-turn-helix transcriptional regulator n=1 Tax=Mycetocola spongiae TaxID=2859226 RepID=UPI001CF5A7A9|nr:MarR family transcriptional regulator [Mycetocola spongiae]UCR90186.1 MarR family transcriptional regulator [Mycetocola spongiae]